MKTNVSALFACCFLLVAALWTYVGEASNGGSNLSIFVPDEAGAGSWVSVQDAETSDQNVNNETGRPVFVLVHGVLPTEIAKLSSCEHLIDSMLPLARSLSKQNHSQIYGFGYDPQAEFTGLGRDFVNWASTLDGPLYIVAHGIGCLIPRVALEMQNLGSTVNVPHLITLGGFHDGISMRGNGDILRAAPGTSFSGVPSTSSIRASLNRFPSPPKDSVGFLSMLDRFQSNGTLFQALRENSENTRGSLSTVYHVVQSTGLKAADLSAAGDSQIQRVLYRDGQLNDGWAPVLNDQKLEEVLPVIGEQLRMVSVDGMHHTELVGSEFAVKKLVSYVSELVQEAQVK